MSDFLGRLAERAIAVPSRLRPRLAPRFAGTAPPPAAKWSDRPGAFVEQDADPGRDPLQREPAPRVAPLLPIAASRQDAPEPETGIGQANEPDWERVPARGTGKAAAVVPEPVRAPLTGARVERAHPRSAAAAPFAPPDDVGTLEAPRARPIPPRRPASASVSRDSGQTAALATSPIAGPEAMTLLDMVSTAVRPAASEPRDVAAPSSGAGDRAEPRFAEPPPPRAPQMAGQLSAMVAPSARPQSRMTPAAAERAPDVSIVIHRLEVRTPADTPRPARAKAAAAPALSLDAYLKSRSRP